MIARETWSTAFDLGKWVAWMIAAPTNILHIRAFGWVQGS
jgi:hypothetical protein